jgi:anti-sigma factor RsiW
MSNEPHVTALDLDLLALGQISPEHVARIEAHSMACPACAARRTEHGEHVRHFRSSVFPRTVERLAENRRPVLPWRWLLGFALPLTACVLLLVHGHGKHPAIVEQPGAPGELGIKGSSARVFARRNRPNTTDVIKLNDGDRLAAGDALRFVLLPTGRPYVLIASIDGAGQVNVYYPFHGEASAEVDPKATVSVPGSIVLDQAPGPERIFFIHSAEPLQARTVRDLLVKLGAGGARMIRGTKHLPIAGTVQSTLLFEKEAGR